MHKNIVSTCSPNNWVCIQYTVKKFPGGYLLLTTYVPIHESYGIYTLIRFAKYCISVEDFRS